MRSIILPPDPEPIINARVEPFAQDEPNFMAQQIAITSASAIGGLGIGIGPIGGTSIWPLNQWPPLYPNAPMFTQSGNNMTTQTVGVASIAGIRSNLGMPPGAQMPLVNATKWSQPIPFLSIIANGTPVVTVTCSSPHGLSTGAQVGIEGTNSVESNGVFSVTVTTATAFTFNANRSIKSGSLLSNSVTMAIMNVGLPLNYNLVPQSGI